MASLIIDNFELRYFDLNAKPEMEFYLSLLNLDISDYTFAANYLWLSNATGFYSIIHNTFCFFVLSGGELSMLLPPLGRKEDVYDAMSTCFDIMNSINSSKNFSKIDYVHEQLLEGFVDYLEEGTEIYEMLESYLVERKVADYVYLSDKLIDLKGNGYSNKRNEINKFIRIHPTKQLEVMDIRKHGDDMMSLFNKWVSDRMRFMPKEEASVFLDGIYSERLAIKRVIQSYDTLGLIGLVILIDGEIKGFTVGERINANTASVIIEKTDFEILGCAQYLFREFTKMLKEEYSAEFINVGDDMGFENLKKVKMSYRPSKLLPKYTIYQK
ncbi:MAG: ribonuclease HII [Gammaproteobacteria bacterium RBG_16_51_14]|nr:MAG: ribonuclease HII [Gammaproteobacteria bacterium RBG_16_51_14]